MRNTLFIFSILFASTLFAQSVEVEKQDNSTYKIRLSDFQNVTDFEVGTSKRLIFDESEVAVNITLLDEKGQIDKKTAPFSFLIDEKRHIINFSEGVGSITIRPKNELIKVSNQKSNIEKQIKVRMISPWMSIVPPLMAILFALLFKEVILSLVLGLFSGLVIFFGFTLDGSVEAFKALIDDYLLNSIVNAEHASIIIFSMLIGGMVAVISKNGGMNGVVDVLSKYAKSARSTQIVTWFLGIVIFFDDYANTLVVGNTMRPVTDKFKVSREKLAYLVDSTAAPVAAIAFVTTWIGAELSYIDDEIKVLNINEGAYSVFLNSLKYSYYPIFTLVFMFIIIWMKRDFGPMLKAENLARKNGVKGNISSLIERELEEFEAKKGIKHRWINALLPVFVVILFTIIGLFYTGFLDIHEQILAKGVECKKTFIDVWQNAHVLSDSGKAGFIQKLGLLIGSSDSYKSLLWASLSGLFLAIILSVSQKLLSIKESFESTMSGFKTMLPAFIILTLAWALGAVTKELNTAEFLTSVFSDNVSPIWMAGITFVLASMVAFSTGTSWGTMTMLYPLMIPAAYKVSLATGYSQVEAMEILYGVVSAVLAGAVLGDHCSPISDTTILSSMASQCDHIEHVKTQLPYALTVGGVSLLAILVFANLGLPWYLNYLLGIGVLYLVVRIFGKPIIEEQTL